VFRSPVKCLVPACFAPVLQATSPRLQFALQCLAPKPPQGPCPLQRPPQVPSFSDILENERLIWFISVAAAATAMKPASAVPGPTGLPWFGVLMDFVKKRGRHYELFDEVHELVVLCLFRHLSFVSVASPIRRYRQGSHQRQERILLLQSGW
jgi:hypothetical protein